MAGQRSTRLSMLALIQEGILEPGEKLLTFDYMGKRCEADLLPDGLIQWNGSKYSSPYAWASQCKNQVNPDHKSGIGWGHIRYKGIKLSQYKTVYIKKHQSGSLDISDSVEEITEPKVPTRRGRKKNLTVSQTNPTTSGLRAIEKHSPPHSEISTVQSKPTIGGAQKQESQVTNIPYQTPAAASSQSLTMTTTSSTSNLLVQCTSFETLELQQPFTVSVTSNTLMIMDFHAHLSISEVVGYLGGTCDENKRIIEVKEAFPCKCDISNEVQSKQVENEICLAMQQKGLVVLGWYHSHPISEPKPSQKDILSQRSYQEAVRRDNGYEPCIGVIISPNHGGLHSGAISQFELYYVIVVQQDGLKASPMKLQYSVKWDEYLTQEVVDEMNALSSYYKGQPICPKFLSLWKGETYFINKFKESLSKVQPKFPEENSDQIFLTYIDQLLASEFNN